MNEVTRGENLYEHRMTCILNIVKGLNIVFPEQDLLLSPLAPNTLFNLVWQKHFTIQ